MYVGGEVKTPGHIFTLGEVTVLRAIQIAGDLTDRANRKKIEYFSANGQKVIINWYKAVEDPRLDLRFQSGDYVWVPARRF